VLFQLFFILFYLLFTTTDVFTAIREYDRSVEIHRHAMWIRLGMFSSIAAALWMLCVAVAMVLNRYKSKLKLSLRMSPYYCSVIECGIIATAINV
jgi:hypothetical protein